MQSLAAVAARNPVWRYQQIQEQPELAVLANEPEIARLHVHSPAKIDLATMPVVSNGRFLAIPVTEGNWGSGDSETRIDIIELATGAQVATIGRVMWTLATQVPTAKDIAEMRLRKHVVESWLADLGFTNVANAEAGKIDGVDDGGHDPKPIAFAKAKITIAVDGTIRHGATVLGHGYRSPNHEIFWLPSQRVFVVHAGRSGSEGCESTDPQWVEMIRVK